MRFGSTNYICPWVIFSLEVWKYSKQANKGCINVFRVRLWGEGAEFPIVMTVTYHGIYFDHSLTHLNRRPVWSAHRLLGLSTLIHYAPVMEILPGPSSRSRPEGPTRVADARRGRPGLVPPPSLVPSPPHHIMSALTCRRQHVSRSMSREGAAMGRGGGGVRESLAWGGRGSVCIWK